MATRELRKFLSPSVVIYSFITVPPVSRLPYIIGLEPPGSRMVFTPVHEELGEPSSIPEPEVPNEGFFGFVR